MSEGSVWEAMLGAAKFHLDNLILIIDKNGLTCDGFLDENFTFISIGRKV